MTRVCHISTVDVSLCYLLLDQMRYLEERGYDVFTISSPGPNVHAVTAAGIPHFAVTMSRTISPFRDLVALILLVKILRRERPDIVHTHTPKAGLLGQLAARLCRTPIRINTIHGFYFHDLMGRRQRWFFIWMERVAAWCSHRMLSQNREDIDTAIREKIVKANKIDYLGNGINLSAFDRERLAPAEVAERRAALGLPEGAKVVGFVGRLAASRKGFRDFLEAAREVRRQVPDTRFLIVGEADRGKPDAVEPSEAVSYGVDDACVFVGQQPNHELPMLYAQMDVIVLPSLFEGMPRVIMEAAAMWVPAVVTDVKGNREVVEPGRNGLIVPYGDVPLLSAAIVRILTEADTAQEMGRQAKLRAAEDFDQRRVFERVAAEYDRLLAARRRA